MEANDTTKATNIVPVLRGVIFSLIPIGFAANLVFLAALLKRPVGSRLTNFLMRTQSVSDAIVCLATALMKGAPVFWSTKSFGLDYFLCLFWHSQYFLWHMVALSVQMLQFTAVDRFMAVECPHWYAINSRKTRVVAGVGVWSFIVSFALSIPATGLVTFDTDEGRCLAELSAHFTFHSVVILHCVVWFVVCYALPVALFVVLYGRVMLTLFRSDDKDNGSNIRASVKKLTVACIINTIIFVASMSYDNYYYVASTLGGLSYAVDSSEQMFGIVLVVVNSCANPFVFLLSMPVFRRTLRELFCCQKKVAPTIQASTQSTAVRTLNDTCL